MKITKNQIRKIILREQIRSRVHRILAEEKVLRRPDDPYEYKYDDNHWWGREQGTDKWLNLKNNDKATVILNQAFPEAVSDYESRIAATPREKVMSDEGKDHLMTMVKAAGEFTKLLADVTGKVTEKIAMPTFFNDENTEKINDALEKLAKEDLLAFQRTAYMSRDLDKVSQQLRDLMAKVTEKWADIIEGNAKLEASIAKVQDFLDIAAEFQEAEEMLKKAEASS